MSKNNRKEFRKYAKFANNIKSIKNQKADNKPVYGGKKEITVLDIKKTKEKSIELMKEISENFNTDEVKSKFWYKMIKHYSEV